MPEQLNVVRIRVPLRTRILVLRLKLRADRQLIWAARDRNPLTWWWQTRAFFEQRRELAERLDDALLYGDGDGGRG